MRTAQVLKT